MDRQVDAQSLTSAIISHARHLGFDHCRIAKVDRAPHAPFFKKWLACDRAGEMAYLERHADKRCEPRMLAEVRNAPVSLNYRFGSQSLSVSIAGCLPG